MEKRGSSDSSAFKVTETATEARQAVTGHGARYVLYWSLAGILPAQLTKLLISLVSASGLEPETC
jgi:hypothetical protein